MNALMVSYVPVAALTMVLTVVQSRLDTLVTNPDLAPLLSLLKGVRNGVVYGSKVRFPHALVYVFCRLLLDIEIVECVGANLSCRTA